MRAKCGPGNDPWKVMQTSAGNELTKALLLKISITGLSSRLWVYYPCQSGTVCSTQLKLRIKVICGNYSCYFRFRYLFGFSAFLSYLIREWIKGRSMYTASNETAGVTRDSKIIKFHAVLELEQKLLMLLRLLNWPVLKFASLLVLGKL